MSLAMLRSRREESLNFARWSARRLASCEIHYFLGMVRVAATGFPEDHRRCDLWRRLAIKYHESLEEDVEELRKDGLMLAGAAIAADAGRRIAEARERCCAANGLSRKHVWKTRLAVETTAPAGTPGRD